MTVCPFCKSPVASSSAKCPRCGRLASDHPSIAAIGGRNLSTDFDDDDDGVPDLARGSSVGGHGDPVSSYEASNATFDDDLMGDDAPAGGALELDMPPMPPAPAAPELPAPEPMAHAAPHAHAPVDPKWVPPPPAESAPRQEPLPPPPKPDAAAIIARYPDPPEPNQLWLMPVYACRVVVRQFELRMDLTSLRRRRSPDVGLYERALKVYDPRSFFIGLAITGAILALATCPVLFWRFVRSVD